MFTKHQEPELWPEALEDEGVVQVFLPRYGRLRDYLEDHTLPFAMLDPMRHGPRPDASLGTGYRVEANNQRDYLGGTLTEAQWAAIREAFGNRCAYCRSARGAWIVEHVVALSKGGRTSIDNCVPACRSCNSANGQKSVERWGGEKFAADFRRRWALALAEAKKKAG